MKIFLVLFAVVSVGFCENQNNFRLCLHTQDSKNFCDQLNRETQTVQCIKADDSIECTNAITNNTADFTILFPEQAHLASGFQEVNEKTTVIAEIRAQKQDGLPHNFQMVAVVRKEHPSGSLVENLRNKKYCHPGFTGQDTWTPRILKEFESFIFGDDIKRNCNERENITYVEQELKVLSEFFGDSCRKGPWTDDSAYDEILRKKYPKLTALCTESTKQDSVSCLKTKMADVAYTTVSQAMLMPDKDNYRILCKNGSTIQIRSIVPAECSWRNQPWPVVLSQRINAELLQTNLRNWISRDLIAAPPGSPFLLSGDKVAKGARQIWQDILAKILLQDVDQYRINILQDQPLLLDFFKRNNQQLQSVIQGECPMRWCTVNQNEQNKCTWLARASLYHGIEPQISCIAGEHIYDCLIKIRQNNADVIAIDSNYGYLARKMGLSNLLYSENSAQDIASIVAVVREDSGITSFKDLKDKKACFPEYRGLAWISFIDSARRHKVMKDNCEFGKSVSDFFSAICAPGAKDIYHYRQNHEMYDKLCSLCPDNCESNSNNKYFNNIGALSCLADNTADVAFVEWQAIENEQNLNFKILCDNENVVSISDYKTIFAECSLSNTVDSEVLTRYNDTRKVDYKLGLLDMDYQFGSQYKNEDVFKMFKEFNGEKNLLFKENVLGLADASQSDNIYVQNYVRLFASVDKCTNAAAMMHISTITVFVSLIIFVLQRNM